MFSGGLDSLLALRILQEQSIETEAFHFTGPFHADKLPEGGLDAKRFADSFGVKLKTCNIENDFMPILKNPRYGYGSNMNPCIDCRIYTLKKAGQRMKEIGASFVATGEVLGQRPMSQRRDMLGVVERRSGMDGLLLRPLSARLLPSTIPEKKGWVDRECLYGIQGRSRKPQMALAQKYGIKNYPNPAGGCLLTDPQFSIKLKDLLKYDILDTKAIEFLKVGRHFRLSPGVKAIVGRDRSDNARILELVEKGDAIIKLKNVPGPITVLKGAFTKKDIETAGVITAKYSKEKDKNTVDVFYYITGADRKEYFAVKPAGDDIMEKYAVISGS